MCVSFVSLPNILKLDRALLVSNSFTLSRAISLRYLNTRTVNRFAYVISQLRVCSPTHSHHRLEACLRQSTFLYVHASFPNTIAIIIIIITITITSLITIGITFIITFKIKITILISSSSNENSNNDNHYNYRYKLAQGRIIKITNL